MDKQMQVFTVDEFVRATFPEPDFEEDKFSGLDKPDLIVYQAKPGAPPRCVLFLYTETTARLRQFDMGQLLPAPNGVVLVAVKGTVSQEDLLTVMKRFNPDAFLFDVGAFTAEHADVARKNVLQNGRLMMCSGNSATATA